MKNLVKFNLLFLVSLMNFSLLYGHSERVHQYIVREAYELLKLNLGYDVPEMLTHLGTDETNGYVDWYTRGNDNFASGKIVCGAFREDVYDIIWGYGNFPFPGINEGLQYALASVTHFWDADYGDDYPTNFTNYYNPAPPIPYSDIPNAYQKMLVYASNMNVQYSGGLLVKTVEDEQVLLFEFSDLVPLSVNYLDIIDFYKTGLVATNGFAASVNPNNGDEQAWPPGSVFFVDEDYRARIIFEILGRMAHLLADMSVPAHVHRDEHRDTDDETYEGQYMYINTDDDPYSNANVNYWNAQKVWDEYGSIMNPYVSNDDPLHHLMYTLNQFADHFASYHYDGDDYKVNDNEELNTYFPTGIAPTSSGTYSNPYYPYTKEILHQNIRDATFTHAIRATAGLLYWFANEAGIIPQKCYLTFTNDFSGISETFNITVNSATEPAPTEPYEVIEGHTIQVEADQNRVYNNVFYEFSHWNDGNTNASRTITASQTETITAYYDAINPPTTPQGLTVSESTDDEHPVLQWTASTGSDITYDIYRQVNYNGWGKIDYSTIPEYKDDGVTTTYRHGDDIYYKVMAVSVIDKDYELYSDYSNTVEIEARLEKNSNEEELVEEMPTEYALNSNYPNPFNPTTQISYQIPNDGFVNLTVYNSLGQEIAALVNQHQSIGRYTVQFNASNLSSGIYFYKLQAGEFGKVNKMLLVR